MFIRSFCDRATHIYCMLGNSCLIFNTCGLAHKDNSSYYIPSITSFLDQSHKGYRLVFSDCCTPQPIRNRIASYFGNAISYNFIDNILPVFTTFNYSVNKMIEHFGVFDSYVYIDSGVSLPHPETLQTFYNFNIQNVSDFGMSALLAVNDNWNPYDFLKHSQEVSGGHVPIGYYLNLHFLSVSEEFRKKYGKCLPDVFKGCGSEGAYPYLCAAIKKKMLMCHEPALPHIKTLDGENVGFPEGIRYALFRREDTIQSIAIEGQQIGFGFEEWCCDLYNGDRSKFGNDEYAINEDLFNFLKQRLFLRDDEFNYSNEVISTFIP